MWTDTDGHGESEGGHIGGLGYTERTSQTVLPRTEQKAKQQWNLMLIKHLQTDPAWIGAVSFGCVTASVMSWISLDTCARTEELIVL